MLFFISFLLCYSALEAQSMHLSEAIHVLRTASVKGKPFLRIGGQFSPILQHTARNKSSATMLGTLGASNSRIFLWHSTPISDDVELRGTLELGFNIQSTVNSDPWHIQDPEIDYRKCYGGIVSKTLGSIFFGQNKTATDDSAEQDCCNSFLSIAPLLYGHRVYTKDESINMRFMNIYHNFDGAARKVCAYYELPHFAGLKVRFGFHNVGDPNHKNAGTLVPEAAVFGRYALCSNGQKGEIRFASAITQDLSRLEEIDLSTYQWSNSISCLLPTGCGVSFSYGQRNYKKKNHPFSKKQPRFWLAKIYHILFRSTNPLSIMVDYSVCSNLHAFNTDTNWYGEATVLGFSLVKTFPRYGVSAFASIKRVQYTLDKIIENGMQFQDSNVFMLGMRVAF